MLQALWPILANLAITRATLWGFFRRQPRLWTRAGVLRWTAVCLGWGLEIHVAIDARSNPKLMELFGLAGLTLALTFLFFPGAAGRLRAGFSRNEKGQ